MFLMIRRGLMMANSYLNLTRRIETYLKSILILIYKANYLKKKINTFYEMSISLIIF